MAAYYIDINTYTWIISEVIVKQNTYTFPSDRRLYINTMELPDIHYIRRIISDAIHNRANKYNAVL